MRYVHRIRRHNRETTRRIARTPGVLTARRFLELQGTTADFAQRYAAQITRTAKQLGTAAAAHTWTTHNGHARRTALYSLATDAIGLITAWAAYKRTAALTRTLGAAA
ncbi:hypothetical protein [Wenjunlia tyrosinilytica]|uniref:Uncharacterized protein n=1 Tax=Wenjunlia tyrosinilytica TaxID=1544741 RepID=A0A918E1N0_9ACTN|nr:hypothetical protein [Wenjunlia tyrosinilytica]GGO98216.1 hypothetical protein GCM10012280_61830 [Wenjunlia tyrosinilytica]